MRVSYRWLSEFVPVALSPEELAERLTLAGLEVESVERPWRLVRDVVLARVLEVAPHPETARLRILAVDDGAGRKPVVTAAPNARAGMWTAYARVGARLPDGRTIGVARFEGQESHGMCLSAAELALPESPGEAGLLEVEAEPGLRPGLPLEDFLELDDAVIVLSLTANYAAHCQSVLGVAREVGALLSLPVGRPARGPLAPEEAPWPGEPPLPEVVVADPEGCRRYVARFLTGFEVRPSPLWMRRRLHAAGVRPHSNVVDVTNYVMLELGQPLHAFDLARLRGPSVGPRAARAGERITTLDGATRSLQAGELVIADGRGPVGIAGVMGGEETEVRGDTRSVLLESAWFHPRRVGGAARRLGLLSEASSRFEKGVDVGGCRQAADRAAALIQWIAGGVVADLVADVAPEPVRPRRLPLDARAVGRHLGLSLTPREVTSLLARVGIAADDPEAPCTTVTVPTYRPDVQEPVDLVEEVGRMYGLNRIPSAPLPGGAGEPSKGARERMLSEAVEIARAAGLDEVVTFSFHPAEWLVRLGLREDDPRARPLRVKNPLSEAQEVMRPVLLPSLLEVLAHNRRVRRPEAGVFELARVYRDRPDGGAGVSGDDDREPAEERLHLAFAVHGPLAPSHFSRKDVRPAGFLEAKGVVETVARRLRAGEIRWTRAEEPFLHPGRAARAWLGEEALGWVGEVHPRVLAAWDLAEPVAAGEVDLDRLVTLARELPELSPPPRHPSVARDLAAIFPQEVTHAEVEKAMRRAGGELLARVELFDVYTGEPVPPGCRSLAYRLVYQDPRRTLTDEEVEAVHARVRAAVRDELGGVLRS
ncbi:MAG: phenylalanine--tRNA ligase subunit beta [Clostridia bacterium]|nr:phenylalanine--tRNA ligase subunit beta [Clostridia bacterium]